MDEDLEARSTLVLAEASEQWPGLQSPERLLTLEPPSVEELQLPPKEPTFRKKAAARERLTRSLDFSVDLLSKPRSKLVFPLFSGPKPSVLAMILRDKSTIGLRKKTSESNVWHNPKVPRFLVRLLLTRTKKPLPNKELLYPATKMPVRRLNVLGKTNARPQQLPPLKGARCMRRTESSLY